MKRIGRLLQQRRMILSMVVLLAVVGLAAWFGMVRQEDPAFPYRYGYVLVQYPGADVEQVQHLVAKPIEEEISEVDEVDEIRSTIRAGFMLSVVGLKQNEYDTDNAWDKVRAAVTRAENRFPQGVLPVTVDDRIIDATTVVLALGGSDDMVLLQQVANRIKNRIYSLPEVSRVRLFGDSGEQVTIALDDSSVAALGLTPAEVIAQLQSRNQIIPGGFVEVDGHTTLIRPQSEFRSVAEISATPIVLPGGSTIPLHTLASVRLEVSEPQVETVWMNGARVVAIAVTVTRNTTNVVAFGRRIRTLVDEMRPEFAPLQIEEMFFQPTQVAERLSELGFSLLLGVVIVGLVLLLMSGLRMGLAVALVVPLVTLSSLALLAIGGGVLHQMAVAGLVIALGMLVDNAIVMVENIQWHMDRGASGIEAAVASVAELAGPLGTATGTTLAVFVPMLIARGDAADFTRAVPVTILLMLGMSYVFAVLVTPLMAQGLLKARRSSGSAAVMNRLGRRIGELSVRHGRLILAVSAGLIALALFASRYLDTEFFPDTDRRQMVVDVYYPEGTPIGITTRFATGLADEIGAFETVEDVFVFTGNSGPRFYYNLNETPRAPQVARLVVVTRRLRDVGAMIDWVRQQSAQRWPGVQVVARRLSQGPPAPAPVELKISGHDRAELARYAEQLTVMLRHIPGTADVRHDLGIGIASLRFEIDDALAESHGLDRARIAQAMALQTQGVEVGQYRAGEDPVPIVLRSPAGTHSDLGRLLTVNAYSAGGQGIPLLDTGNARWQWQTAVIHHLDRLPTVTVYSELQPGASYPQVFEAVFKRLPELHLPPGIRVVAGGYQESSGEANTAMFRSLPIGLLLLLSFLLLQFNSFQRVLIVLVTAPMALAGVVPGLLLTGNSFGFMALLGVIALVGIVVNNAIVLIDVVDQNLDSGLSPAEAVTEAVSRRTRPILLTTLTTVAGLMPLTFASSTLWPPMAWCIISGLLAATLLTLGVVPALCFWWLRSRKISRT